MKEVLFIEGRRDGYTPKQCAATMTVGELIEYLQNYDEDMEIYLKNDEGYTYGSIDESSFTEEFLEDQIKAAHGEF